MQIALHIFHIILPLSTYTYKSIRVVISQCGCAGQILLTQHIGEHENIMPVCAQWANVMKKAAAGSPCRFLIFFLFSS